MSRFLLLSFLILLGCSLTLSCERFDKHVQKFCIFAKESQPCTKPNYKSLANRCCNSAGKCNSQEFPINEVCCFTQACLDRCYPGKGHRTGIVY